MAPGHRVTRAANQPDAVCYDRRRGRLEVEFTWTDDVRQFHPVSPQLYRQLITAPKPMYLALDRLIFRPRWMRSEYVRTETKPAIAMARIMLWRLEPNAPMQN